ncbi:MAG: hypothetical protein PHY95_03865 [Candidatus ainarchaeum sp.]|nr:hypothetical protein [Candidatus ainarchaeum sp.]
MNTKAVATGVIIIAAFAVGAYIFFMQPGSSQDPWAGRDEVYLSEFSRTLSSSSELYLVMDLRGADEDAVRSNIMQCAVDISYSIAIGGINKSFYSLGSECIRTYDNGTTYTVPLAGCLDEISAARDVLGKSIIYIRKANETKVFWNELVVGMGANYTENGCNIGVRNPRPVAPAAGVNTSTNGTQPAAGEQPELPVANGSGAQETEVDAQ